MKITILTLTFLLTLSLFHPLFVSAQSNEDEEDTENVTEEAQDAIEKIKDAVASKVAELDLVEKKGIFGNVVEVSNNEITIEDENGIQRIVEIDELTRFEGERQSDDFGISDIENGSRLSAVGLYNKETEKLLARFITQKVNIPLYISGAVKEVNEDEFTLTVVNAEGKEYIVDIERSTDTMVYEDEELADSGFSEITVGEKVIVTGLESKNEENRISAERVLHFKALPPTSEVKKHLPQGGTQSEESLTPTPEEE